MIERRVVTVTLAEQRERGILPEPATKHPHAGQPPVILDNGSFPKTRPCARKRARSRWRRKRRST